MPGKQMVNVLVLEDDDLDFQILARRLCADHSRYHLLHARSLKDARQIIGRQFVDIGLFDYRLADNRSGLDFVRELGGRAAPFPIILMTGVDDAQIDRDAILSGAYDYIDKFALTAETADRAIRFAISSRNYETQLRAAINEAKDQALINRRILAIVGHEMHSPLRSIIGYCDHLGGDDKIDVRRDAASKVKIAATHLEDFLRNLSEFVRLDDGNAKLIEEPFYFGAMVRETVGFFEPYAVHKSILLEMQFVNADVCIVGDRLRLRQILINLLRNAVTHTDEGSIKIFASVDDGVMSIEVRDDGVGMSADKIAAVMADRLEPHTAMPESQGGLGIGLSICQRLLRLMGGHLSIESSPGRGTTMVLIAPARLADPARAA